MFDSQYIEKLPLDATFTVNKGLCWKDQPIGLLLPLVQSKVQVVTDGAVEDFVKLKIVFASGDENANISPLPLRSISKIDWFALDARCILNPDCSKAGHYLACIIKSAVSSAPVEIEYLINRLGTHIVNGMPLFCTGDRLVLPRNADSKHNVVLAPKPYHLAVDTDRYPEKQAVAGMVKLVQLGVDAGRMIFAHSLLNVLRMAYIEIGITPCCILFLVGETGLKKTTFASFMTRLYNRDEGIDSPLRLNASVAAAEVVLNEMCDCTVVLDDLFPANSSQIKRKQEKTLIELTRIIGDNSGRARMSGKQVVSKQPRCGVLVTGEYLIGTGSDAARLLPISLKAPIDSAKLQTFQNEPLLLSTFYHFFIEWYIENWGGIQKLLTNWLTDFREKNYGVHARLQETLFCLSSAYKLFLQYCVDREFTLAAQARQQFQPFYDSLVKLIRAQNERVKQVDDHNADKIDFLKLIRTLHKSNGFHVANNAKQLKEKHDGVIHHDCLCLRGTKLLEKIQCAHPATNLDDVIRSLVDHDALKRGSDKNSIQISGYHGKRFFAIKLGKLQ